MKDLKVEVELKDLYQLLICDMRYAYTRNNHLTPSGEYEKIKKIICDMFKVDNDYAIYTLKQICEECISEELVYRFYDGLDDEFGNRASSIEFISWCLGFILGCDNNWKPYNYDLYLRNLSFDTKPMYEVYVNDVRHNDELISKKEILNYICDIILHNDTICYTKELIKDNLSNEYDYGVIYHIKEPNQLEIKVVRRKLNEKN